MKRILLTIATLLPALPAALLAAEALPHSRPNVLFILADDLRPDGLHALGNTIVKTPNLDRLVQQGFIFRCAYTQGSDISAVCFPSRTMIQTGRSYLRKDRPTPTWAQTVAAAGYASIRSGKFGTNPDKLDVDFDQHVNGENAQGNADNIIAFIRAHAGRKPLFLYMASNEPHDPQFAPAEYYRMYRAEQIPLPAAFLPLHPFDNGAMDGRDEATLLWPRTRQSVTAKLARYYASTSYLDAQAGRVIAALRQAGQLQNTVIVIAGDNGLSLGEHGLLGKQNLYEFGGMHVPLVFVGPGIPRGESQALVYLYDIYPTICQLTGVPVPAGLDGQSLLGVIQGRVSKVRDLLFTAYRLIQRAIRDERWKLIRYTEINKTQLFDLAADPHETVDLATRPERAREVQALTAALEQAQRQYGDDCPLSAAAPKDPSFPLEKFPRQRPNILWLVSEDNNPFLGCYGDKLAHTPTLDRLAAEGVLYEHCFAEPVCATSRFALISGMYAATCGPAEHMRAAGKIPAWLKGFPALLRQAGYYTTNNAKTDYNSPIRIDEAWDQCNGKAHWKRRGDPARPFFAVFNHEVTHESCLFPLDELPLSFPPTDPACVRVPPYQPDTPAVRADWARYYNHMRLLDQQIAAKLKDLDKTNLGDNTIVFYYADNGGVLPRSKRFLELSGTHVPLVVYFPPKWEHLAPALPGARIEEPVCFCDFAPTVLSLVGLKVPAYMQGHALAGPARAAPQEFVFCSRDRMDERYDMFRSAMDRRWLYVRNYRPDLPYVQFLAYQFQARGYQSWAERARQGKLTPATAMFWGEKPAEELYDVQSDPDNVRNLAHDPAHCAELERMRGALRRWMLAINDNGFIPEGSPLEGYDASRRPGAFPIQRVIDLAELASRRDPAQLPKLIEALDDANEAMRWWAAQGCTMLGPRAAPAEAPLRRRLSDASGAVQVAATEALARLGRAEAALPVLEHWLENAEPPAFALQAANVLERLGEAARPSLPVMRRVSAALAAETGPANLRQFLRRSLERTMAVLEGRAAALVYPPANERQ
jgi:arylsulfatase A-like enzyme